MPNLGLIKGFDPLASAQMFGVLIDTVNTMSIAKLPLVLAALTGSVITVTPPSPTSEGEGKLMHEPQIRLIMVVIPFLGVCFLCHLLYKKHLNRFSVLVLVAWSCRNHHHNRHQHQAVSDLTIRVGRSHGQR